MTIKDFQACSPIPGGAYGAACDNFLTSHQLILSEAQWQELQASWFAKGQVSECMSSGNFANLKSELEKLCSETQCNDDESSAVNTTLQGVNRMMALAKKSRNLSPHQ